MSIATAIAEALERPELAAVRDEAQPMQRVYEEMQRNGYAPKQGYAIASMDELTGMRAASAENKVMYSWL
ncbi:Uncharacterised protein [Burkholderia pseudomallei]|uniref:hypothetical protein n=1 Tax=Burkholderia vietnamiensis TaxID=60552 RepID=UPI00158D6943|nr:hypothetical protein [Burkholderia vietnamiensis]CAJ3120204.1 Uncharacterised protein [Burkholderia pseudomallei]CAJ3586760.1 Uncharacterised protein [Burkholderia pseudomallei]CAJ5392814.1 Uncharacterised protein [Burkholderia pseudomallei]CAJ9033243.1 Uncharacterised protein [Burkholderia pseudomallei]CAJ9836295.1 Uncharacterised protein [Burkholderia pseudomallei]